MHMDASQTGWGTTCQGEITGGPWSQEETQYHINYLELLAVVLTIQTFAREKVNTTIQVQTDNISAMTYINRRGGTQSPPLSELARRTLDWCMERRTYLTAEHHL
jgi:hypothetical protein